MISSRILVIVFRLSKIGSPNMYRIFFTMLLLLLTVGCASNEFTSLQIREMQSKDLEGTFDQAYKANLQVLQDYGYVIKNSDYKSGIIQGETGFKKDKDYFWNALTVNSEVTATLEQFGPNTVKERLSLVKNYTRYYGGHENSETLVDPHLYQKIYDDIQKEMFVRKNLSK